MLSRIAIVLLVLALPAHAAPDLLIQRAGQPPHTLTPMTQQAPIEHAQRTWTGPLLWNVLVAAGAVDPARPADAVRLGVRVIGADGWTAVFGLAELSPEFAGKPIQLADKVSGQPTALRLIVPGEHRGGRSVRDVVRIEIE